MKPTTSLLSIVLISALCAVTAPGQTAPIIKASADEWNFGIRDQGERDEFIVKIQNVGNDLLEINDVRVTCGCVKGKMERRTILPGQSGNLVLTLDTARQHGRIRKYAYVQCNDPKKRQLVIKINGEIRADWRVSSKSVNFGKVAAGAAAEQEFQIIVKPDKYVSLKGIHSSSTNVVVESSPFGKRGEKHGWNVRLKLKETIAPGPFTAALTIDTDNRNTPRDTVMAHARVDGGVKVTPARLYFGRIFHGRRKSIKMVVEKAGATDFAIKGVTGDNDRLTSMVREVDAGRRYDVIVTLEARPGDVDIAGSVTVETNDPMQAKIVVDILARGAPPR